MLTVQSVYFPDPPVLANDPTVTTDLQIKLTWPVPFDGGIPTLEYDIYYDQSTGEFVTLTTAVTDLHYTTTVALIPGNTYGFKAISRSWYGESVESSILYVLAAKEPDAPINIAEVPAQTTGYQIGFVWQDGVYDGASPVIDYEVSFKQTAASDYAIHSSSYLNKYIIITGLTPGVSYDFVVKSRNIINFSVYSTQLTVVAA